jgi:uncharacterized protein (DUF849 family)
VDANKVVLEVGVNESTQRDVNPNVPWTVDEIVDDIRACAGAGAAIVHYHARQDDGGQAWSDADINRAILEGVGEHSDVLCYPTYFGDLSHIWDLADHPPVGAPLEIVSFDILQELGGRIDQQVFWDDVGRQFEPVRLYSDDAPKEVAPPPTLAEYQRRGLHPEFDASDLGAARWAGLATLAGFIPEPLDLRLYLCDHRVVGPVPTPEAIDMYLAQLPADIDAECTVVGYGMLSKPRYEALLRGGLERGINIRVGIGDSPRADPHATNVELVEWAVSMIRDAGLEPATPNEVRERFGLATRTAPAGSAS